MATKAAAGVVGGAARAAPFRTGEKKVFLPNHVITFVRPKANQPPTTATFHVPLTFNKLDFRDYLWNVYNVEVTSVRSFVNQMQVRQRSFKGFGGKWYRPRSQKMMVVDLVKPFVWPEAPEDKSAWDHEMFTAIDKTHKEQLDLDFERTRGTPPLRPEMKTTDERLLLRQQARELMNGTRKWRPGQALDPAWVEVEADEAVSARTNEGGESTS
ncbi:54S ribosomal protein L23, mitochondrial [Cytospora mali]|uniref:Large ribosomal subunit protein uL23m n=1 Tax=Cytospora mali TaxID=578113 RepID=A0A194V9Z1_CYTMA|nr:54S ribosomal protein L23, mitochondrial [Valsa mali var. pyri (nom. inval.)]